MNKRAIKRSGFRIIYKRLLDTGYFNGLEKTPLYSVRSAQYSEAVKILSLLNTGIQ